MRARSLWFSKAIVLASVLVVVRSMCVAQAPVAFDTVTIKPSASSPRHHIGFDGRHFVTSNVPLHEIILFAYGLPAGTLLQGGPDWVNAANYDIVATMDRIATGEPNQQTGRPMIQQLLRSQFHLALHTEQHEITVFALVPAKNGPKLKLAATQSSGPGGISHTGAHILEGKSATATMLVWALEGETRGAIVLDQTGLSGRYDFTLHSIEEQTPQTVNLNSDADPMRAFPPRAPAETYDAQCMGRQLHGDCYLDYIVPPLRAALEAQLGLTLKTAKQQADVMVIDHVEKPTLK